MYNNSSVQGHMELLGHGRKADQRIWHIGFTGMQKPDAGWRGRALAREWSSFPKDLIADTRSWWVVNVYQARSGTARSHD